MSAPSPERGRRRLAGPHAKLALAAVLLVGLAYATVIQSFSWNQTSHYDLIRALNNDTTTIDAYQGNTGDKVFYRQHWYSARAPGLALFALPFYDTLSFLGADSLAQKSQAQRNDDEMIYFVGLWANVLPGLLLLLLVWRVAERFEPGYGAATAVVLGLGTMVLPLSTLLFSHVFTAFLGFAAFALMLRERDGPPSLTLLGLAGMAMGYAVASEYPLFFVALVLGLFLLSRRDSLSPGGVLRRAGAYIVGGLVGIVPLLLYNHYAFRSWTHLAYSDVPRQQKGFFGIGAPSLKVLSTLLFDSRGLLTISPVLLLGGVGTVLLYRRGRRAEALTIGGICLCYLGYNSGYYLPFGGGFMGPRFLTTMLPFLAFPIGIALRRLPGPTLALAGVSIAATVIASITHPLVGYENETVVWARLLGNGEFQPTIASAFGLGRGWGGIWPFLLAVGRRGGAGRRCDAETSPVGQSAGLGRTGARSPGRCSHGSRRRALGIDHQGLLSIVGAGDTTALNLSLHDGTRYPLARLAVYCFDRRRAHRRGDVGAATRAAGAALARQRDRDRSPGRRRRLARAPQPLSWRRSSRCISRRGAGGRRRCSRHVAGRERSSARRRSGSSRCRRSSRRCKGA